MLPIWSNSSHGGSLRHGFGRKLAKQRPAKKAAELFAPTIFNGKRCGENVTEAGMVIVDVDHDASLEKCLKRISELRCRSRHLHHGQQPAAEKIASVS